MSHAVALRRHWLAEAREWYVSRARASNRRRDDRGRLRADARQQAVHSRRSITGLAASAPEVLEVDARGEPVCCHRAAWPLCIILRTVVDLIYSTSSTGTQCVPVGRKGTHWPSLACGSPLCTWRLTPYHSQVTSADSITVYIYIGIRYENCYASAYNPDIIEPVKYQITGSRVKLF